MPCTRCGKRVINLLNDTCMVKSYLVMCTQIRPSYERPRLSRFFTGQEYYQRWDVDPIGYGNFDCSTLFDAHVRTRYWACSFCTFRTHIDGDHVVFALHVETVARKRQDIGRPPYRGHT